MDPPQPLQPLCVASTPNGTIYATSLSFNANDISAEPDPDWFLLLRGSLPPSNDAHDIRWDIVAATNRANVNLFPEIKYQYVCGVSQDGQEFILLADRISTNPIIKLPSRPFTILIRADHPLQQQPSPTSTNGSNNGDLGIIQTVTNGRFSAPNKMVYNGAFLVSTRDLPGGQQQQNSSSPSPTGMAHPDNWPFSEWIYVYQTEDGATNYAKSNLGAFPGEPQGVLSELMNKYIPNDAQNYSQTAFALYNTTLLSYRKTASTYGSTLYTLPFNYNATSPTPFQAPDPSLPSKLLTKPIQEPICMTGKASMTVIGSNMYTLCLVSTNSPYLSFFKIDLLSNSEGFFDIDVTDPLVFPSVSPYSPTLLAVSDYFFLYTNHVDSFYYTMNVTTGDLAEFNMGLIPGFSGKTSPNLDMSGHRPMTLSNFLSMLIVLGTLLLAWILIGLQTWYFRRWLKDWIDETDIPGSKFAEEDMEYEEDYDRYPKKTIRSLLPRKSKSPLPVQHPYAGGKDGAEKINGSENNNSSRTISRPEVAPDVSNSNDLATSSARANTSTATSTVNNRSLGTGSGLRLYQRQPPHLLERELSSTSVDFEAIKNHMLSIATAPPALLTRERPTSPDHLRSTALQLDMMQFSNYTSTTAALSTVWMDPPQPLQPLCIATTPNGTLFATSLSYNANDISAELDPDWFLLLKGSAPPSSKAQDIQWQVVAATNRANVNLFPKTKYQYVCGVSQDGQEFMMLVERTIEKGARNVPFTILIQPEYSQMPSSSSPSNVTESAGGLGIVQTNINGFGRAPTKTIYNAAFLISTRDLPGEQQKPSVLNNQSYSNRPFQEWIYLYQTDSNQINYSTSNHGAFPTEPQGALSEFLDATRNQSHTMTFAYYNLTYLSLTSFWNSNLTLYTLPLYYNGTSPRPFQGPVPSSPLPPPPSPLPSPMPSPTLAPPPRSSSLLATTLSNLTLETVDFPNVCYWYAGSMSIIGHNVYTLCTVSYDGQMRLVKTNIWSNSSTTYEFRVFDATWSTIFDAPWSTTYNNYAPSLLAVSNSFFLYTNHIDSFYYTLDVTTGDLSKFDLGLVPSFPGTTSPNLDTSNQKPLTLSTFGSLAIFAATLLLSWVLVECQSWFFRRQLRNWVDGSDIPGSKVAEEIDEETYQQYRQAVVQSMLQQQGQQPEEERKPQQQRRWWQRRRSLQDQGIEGRESDLATVQRRHDENGNSPYHGDGTNSQSHSSSEGILVVNTGRAHPVTTLTVNHRRVNQSSNSSGGSSRGGVGDGDGDEGGHQDYYSGLVRHLSSTTIDFATMTRDMLSVATAPILHTQQRDHEEGQPSSNNLTGSTSILLDTLHFSSHPRPNFVTSITDEPSTP
ncbi:hypothetical protein BGZ83_006829 [Gryganskiella cystojenkinii]|nr:hypothetical protein BGZ83_006829 [Gryganskiella cystojenkinii]